ncbi:uncharacterized protein KD926_010215 [Aspergillus affinis]|uniref:uncharacterized protein n=1 Tax=Aspergillus affinis TaxID=1070780 RepID=UPI0022FDFCC1|nr:uncharacterized protein KD926_010215 [Aspergillus affinis]KAI9038882.1 hypothetical protein KD926_010215 [Aspergillus affinis]
MTRDDKSAATLAAKTFRTLMALTGVYDLEIREFDALNAFVNSEIDEIVYTECPDGFKVPEQDPCLFTDGIVILIFYVDDFIVLSSAANKRRADEVIEFLSSKYFLREIENADTFLGIKIRRDRGKRTIHLSQLVYIDKITTKFNLKTSQPPKSPLPTVPMTLYSGKASPRQIQEFQEKVGSILWSAVITRPDIAKSASELSRFLVNPGPDYLAAANRVIQFLYGTRFYGIRYSKSGDPNAGEVFIMASDAAFGDHTDRKSFEGLVCLLYGGPVDWHTGKQKTVSTSTTEAELLAISEAGKNVFWWKRLFNALQFNL